MGETVSLEAFRKEGEKVRSVTFTSAIFLDSAGNVTSVELVKLYDPPVDAEVVNEMATRMRDDGGFYKNGYFIPWPCAAIKVEFAGRGPAA